MLRSSMARCTALLFFFFFFALSISGCYSKATAYDGKLTFAYATGLTQVENFVKPIAPGAKLDVVAFANGTQDALTITRAKSTKPAVLAIDSVNGKTLTLKGIAPGVAEIEITAQDKSGNELVDTMFFHVAKPAIHKLEHSCTEGSEAAYIRGENIDVWHSLMTSDKRFVMGYDYAPVAVEPARALDLVLQPQSGGIYRFKSKANGKVTIRSTIDGGALSLKVIDRSSLKEADLHHGDRIIAGRSEYAFVEVLAKDSDNGTAIALCNQNALTKVKSLTPDICKVSARLDDDDDDDGDAESNRAQLVTVTGVKFGECSYEVSLPELNGGRGIVLSGKAKIGREEFPGDRGGGNAAPPPPAPAAKQRVFESLPRMAMIYVIARIGLLLGLLAWQRRRRRTNG